LHAGEKNLVKRVNEAKQKEASVIRDMSTLPKDEQVQFWHEEFMPVRDQEHALREMLLLAGQKASSRRSNQ